MRALWCGPYGAISFREPGELRSWYNGKDTAGADGVLWIKVTLAAVMSGALFSVIDTVLPPRSPQPFVVVLSDWPGDMLFALMGPLGLAPSPRLVPLELRRAAPGEDAVAAFRAGQADAALVGPALLPGLLSDEVRLIYAYDEVVGGGALVAAPGVLRAADLGNRPVGVSSVGGADPLTKTLLQRAGLDGRAPSITPLVPEAVAAELAAGRIGAAVVLSPTRAKAIADHLGTSILASTQDLAGLTTHVLLVREGTIAGRRDQVVAVLRALSATADACRGDRERCLELLASAGGRPADEWRQDFEALHLLDADDSRALMAGTAAAPLARRLAGLGLPPAMDWLDPSLVEEAARP